MTSPDAPIVVDQVFSVPTEVVWSAITEPERMRGWFFPQISDFEATVGFETQFLVQVEGRDFLHVWKVQEVTPGRQIRYAWSYEGYPGDSTVTWDVTKTPDGCRLVLTQQVDDKMFDPEDPLLNRAACEAGWCYFLQESLPKYLADQG